MSYTVRLEGADRLRDLLQGDKLLAKPIKNALKAVGALGKEQGRAYGPRRTGRLVQSVGYRVSSKPRWVAVQVKATRSGFSYPRLLEFSGKHGHRGWFMQAIQGVMGRMGGILNQAASEIEREWRGGRG